jgi:hypothetical protein
MAMKLPPRVGMFLCVFAVATALAGPLTAQASCGSVSCFVVIGSQQQVSMAGALTVNLMYNYTPMEAPSGEGGRIPFANQGDKTLTLANLNVNRISTTTRTAILDLNYGLTERLGIQVAIPYKHVDSNAQIGGVAPVPYSEGGLGDIRATLKYNVLPTLRSMMVLGVGVDFPSGSYGRFARGNQLAESTLQIGRGNFGVIPMVYQTYELIPHRVNQFALASYRHTFKNSDGYQFGDEVNVSAGLNIIPFEKTPWLTLIQQFNFRWMQNDAMDASLWQFFPATGTPVLLDPTIKFRAVPTTGSTYLAYSPGINLNLWNYASFYFIAQIPIHRDFNGNVEQQISYVFGLTKSFQLFGGS